MEFKEILLPQPSNTISLEMVRSLQELMTNLKIILNGGILFSDNFDCSIVEHTFTTTDTEEEISHGLGKIPEYYLIANLSASAIIYNGDTSFTNAKIYLKASATCTVKLIIF